MLELVLIAAAPVLFILLYVYYKDKFEPEPLSWIVKIFILGALTAVPAGVLEFIFVPLGVSIPVVIAPIIEESLKFLVVYFTVFRDQEFSEPVDGIVYAVTASLGFATIENFVYVIPGGISVGILRAFLSIPAHAFYACIWGYALGLARFKTGREAHAIILTGLIAAMVTHGAYNYLASIQSGIGVLILFLIFMPLALWLGRKLIFQALASQFSEEYRDAHKGEVPPTVQDKTGQVESPPAPPEEESSLQGRGKSYSHFTILLTGLIILNVIGIPIFFFYMPCHGPCPAGYFRDTEECSCIPEGLVVCNCGGYKYCEPGGTCCNNRWIACPLNTRLGKDCKCYY